MRLPGGGRHGGRLHGVPALPLPRAVGGCGRAGGGRGGDAGGAGGLPLCGAGAGRGGRAAAAVHARVGQGALLQLPRPPRPPLPRGRPRGPALPRRKAQQRRPRRSLRPPPRAQPQPSLCASRQLLPEVRARRARVRREVGAGGAGVRGGHVRGHACAGAVQRRAAAVAVGAGRALAGAAAARDEHGQRGVLVAAGVRRRGGRRALRAHVYAAVRQRGGGAHRRRDAGQAQRVLLPPLPRPRWHRRRPRPRAGRGGGRALRQPAGRVRQRWRVRGRPVSARRRRLARRRMRA
mmetsp:Transcript_7687/g.32402  ORF Transcript_7687/g.32402 Transcript_7687/m.32402 type:complete len:292 (-) Transcript_7687:808-1683(-)